MNNLSWLLYLGDVCHGLKGVLIFSIIILFMYIVIGTIIASAIKENFAIVPYFGKVFAIFTFFMFISVIIPSKQTVYLIAASQTSQQIINSKTGQKAEKLLNLYINKEIQNLKQKNN